MRKSRGEDVGRLPGQREPGHQQQRARSNHKSRYPAWSRLLLWKLRARAPSRRSGRRFAKGKRQSVGCLPGRRSSETTKRRDA
jgi:hypothetical protein